MFKNILEQIIGFMNTPYQVFEVHFKMIYFVYIGVITSVIKTILSFLYLDVSKSMNATRQEERNEVRYQKNKARRESERKGGKSSE